MCWPSHLEASWNGVKYGGGRYCCCVVAHAGVLKIPPRKVITVNITQYLGRSRERPGPALLWASSPIHCMLLTTLYCPGAPAPLLGPLQTTETGGLRLLFSIISLQFTYKNKEEDRCELNTSFTSSPHSALRLSRHKPNEAASSKCRTKYKFSQIMFMLLFVFIYNCYIYYISSIWIFPQAVQQGVARRAARAVWQRGVSVA